MEKDLWKYLKTATKPIVLYGMGNGADKIIKVLESNDIKFSGVFATDGFVREKIFHGFKIETYQSLKEKFGDMIVLLCFGSSRPEVLENIKRISLEQELYAPDVPVYGGGLFFDYLKENERDFLYVYSHLADETSRQTFADIINYKLSGKLSYLENSETDEREFLKFTDNESYIDLGAYNGDTVLSFINEAKNYNSIIAVEPDFKNFKKLKVNTEGIEGLKIINACVTNFSGTADFSMNSGRNSSFGGEGKIRAVTVDEIAENPTFIKMDIEGEELKAIEGARKTIESLKPKMQIAAYHRTEDLTEIPIKIYKMRNDYNIYLRKNKGVPAWDINYYFV